MSGGNNRVTSLVITAFLIGVMVAVVEAARRRQSQRPALQVVPGPAEPAAWVLPQDDVCPTGFPVKVKESSGIFHLPGGAHYDRVHPDRCYTSAEAASGDGFRRSRT